MYKTKHDGDIAMIINNFFKQTVIVVLSSLFIATTCWGHSAWLEKRQDEIIVVYKDGPDEGSYTPEKVAKVTGYDNNGKVVKVDKKEAKGGYVPLALAEGTALVALTFDNGFWCEDAKGKWHNLPKSKVEGAKQGGHYVKYSLTVVDNYSALPDDVDLPLVIIPQSNPLKLHAGDELRIRVMFNGKPLADAKVMGDYVNQAARISAVTDADGYANLTIRNQGLNVISVAKDEMLKDNPDADKLGMMGSLAFTLKGAH